MHDDGLHSDRFHFQGIPLLMLRREGVRGPTVVVLHGLGADKDGQRTELRALAWAGFVAVALDAPHHGERRSAWLDELHAADPSRSHLMFLRLLPALVDDACRVVRGCPSDGGPVALLGISMGAYAALAAAPVEPRLAAVVSILGSPDWSARPHARGDESDAISRHAPVHHPERFPPLPLFMANAGRDENVPPQSSRAFHHALQPLYASMPSRLRYLEYPESPHFLREADWQHLWVQVLAFLHEHLRR